MEYNNTMGGVDRIDQHLINYPIIKKRTKKNYEKIFFHFYDISLWNASFFFFIPEAWRKIFSFEF